MEKKRNTQEKEKHKKHIDGQKHTLANTEIPSKHKNRNNNMQAKDLQ